MRRMRITQLSVIALAIAGLVFSLAAFAQSGYPPSDQAGYPPSNQLGDPSNNQAGDPPSRVARLSYLTRQSLIRAFG